MKYEIKPSNQFKKDLKVAEKRGLPMNRLLDVIDTLAAGDTLEPRFRDHELTGDYIGFRECHIMPDWLLIYRIQDDELLLFLSRSGTHSDLF